MLQEAEKKLEEVKIKQKGNGALAQTTTAKEVWGEKTRLLKQHENKKKELEEKGEKAAKAKERQATEKVKAIEEEEKRHKKNFEALDK